MKKSRKTAVVAVMFASAVALSGCGKDSDSSSRSVIGKIPNVSTTTTASEAPAASEDETTTTTTVKTTTTAESSEAPAEYDPSSEEIQDVYGPPEDLSEYDDASVDEDDSTVIDIDSSEDFKAFEQEVPCVYGPPEDFE